MSDNGRAAPAVVLDQDGEDLRLGAEKAKYAEAIATARKGIADAQIGALTAALPAAADAPKGEVVVGDKAGAFGPWRAHQVVDEIAGDIAKAAGEALRADCKPRVLVVGDRAVLAGDWTARHVRSTLDRQARRLGALSDRIDAGLQDLDRAEPGRKRPELLPRRKADAPTLDTEQETEEETAAPASTGGGSGAAAATAMDLLGLLRTDYTITATAVSAGPTELATLTAAHLAAPGAEPGVVVYADDFSTVGDSSSAGRVPEVLVRRDVAAQHLSELKARLAGVEAELALTNARRQSLEESWAAAVVDPKAPPGRIGTLRTTVDQLVDEAASLARAAGPARAVVAHAEQAIADIDASLAALVTAPAGGQSPLLTAVRWERIDAVAQAEKVSHVLYVSLDAIGADAVTRRSILGTSGRIQFLGAGNASWLLMDTDGGSVVRGGQASTGGVMTFDLQTGAARCSTLSCPETNAALDTDPLLGLERWAKVLVVVLTLAIVALGFMATLAVVKAAF